MKKAEAISILATSVRPREPKDRARYDEAVKMAIEALKCSETPKSSERTAETAQNVSDSDLISRKAAIDALARMMPRSYTPDGSHPADEEIFRAQEVFADCIEALEILPSAAPSTAHITETTAETTAPSTDDWIPVERELPEDLAEVNVTWVNPFAKSKPFTASAVYCEGNWYWYSSVCADVLAEYGRNDVDKVDDMIEITAWRPLPEPYRGGDSE